MALVALLRGVNIGGHRTFRPSILARELSDYDVVNVGAASTYVVRTPDLDQSSVLLPLEFFAEPLPLWRLLPFSDRSRVYGGSGFCWSSCRRGDLLRPPSSASG